MSELTHGSFDTREKEYVTKDSGQRAEFSTGAKRDLSKGKGRFDLLAPFATRRVASLSLFGADGPRVTYPLAVAYEHALYALDGTHAMDNLAWACAHILEAMGGFAPGMMRLAGLYERGAEKYDARNWEKGIPIPRMFDSGIRHLTQAIGGAEDEDHPAGSLFNFMGIIEFDERIRRGDLPASLFDGLPNRWMAAIGEKGTDDTGTGPA